MSTPEDKIAKELRAELEARLSSYKEERARLLFAQSRISELDQLIAYIESEPATVKVDPRKKPIVGDDVAAISDGKDTQP